MNIDGAAAIVTGAASGLGAATARELAGGGARVTVLDVDDAAGEAVAAEVRGRYVHADIAVEEDIVAAVDAATAAHGPARIVVNCAGIGIPGRRTAGRRGPYPLDLFRRAVEVNLIGAFNVVRLGAQAMLDVEPQQGERGVIVNTASVNAYDGPVGTVAYTAAKGGVVAMTLPLARDLAPFGIRVCTVAPGNFGTPMLLAAPDEFLRELQATVPFPSDRFGDPSEFARLVRHVCENQMLNGEVIRLDGAVRMSQR